MCFVSIRHKQCRNRAEWLGSIRTFVLLFFFFNFQVFRWTICIYILFSMSSCGSFLNCACSFYTAPVACSLWVDIGCVPMGCLQPRGWWVWREGRGGWQFGSEIIPGCWAVALKSPGSMCPIAGSWWWLRLAKCEWHHSLLPITKHSLQRPPLSFLAWEEQAGTLIFLSPCAQCGCVENL